MAPGSCPQVVLSFFHHTKAWTQHLLLPQPPKKNFRNIKNSTKIFEIRRPQKNVPILYRDFTRKSNKCIEMTPAHLRSSPFYNDPPKYPQFLRTPPPPQKKKKKFILLKKKKTHTKYWHLKLWTLKMARAWVYICKFSSTPTPLESSLSFEPSHSSIPCLRETRRLGRDCARAQSRLSLRWSLW